MVNRDHACHTIQTKRPLGMFAIFDYPRDYILLSEKLIWRCECLSFYLAYFASGIGHASVFGNWVKSPKTLYSYSSTNN